MMKQHYLDIVRQVLDHEVVDSNNVPCGMVDDLELEGGPGEELRVTALLVGPGAWTKRLPSAFEGLARLVFGARATRVPWSEVESVTERVKLKSEAEELGLGGADRRAAGLVGRLPGSG
jgi:sporulation protein YlmC with PRC-barrel domain